MNIVSELDHIFASWEILLPLCLYNIRMVSPNIMMYIIHMP